MIKVGLYGGSGYMGGEFLRIAHEHPELEISWVTSRKDTPVAHYHKNFVGVPYNFTHPDNVSDDVDVVVSALPSGIPMSIAGDWLKKGKKFIDLGADFRLKDQATWERVYGKKHSDFELTKQAVYGIPELHRDKIKQTNIVANPGCYSSASILGLAPLLKAGAIEKDKIIIDGLSGSVGAGAELDTPLHHPELANNILPYNVVDHRHSYEIEQELGSIAGSEIRAHFSAYYTPISRGIVACCHGFLKQDMNRSQILDLYRDFYGDEQFIKVIDWNRSGNASWEYLPYPAVAATSGTNYCHIGLDVDQKRGRVVVFSALDSIGKGGAHAAVQNINLLFGLPENTGLQRLGNHPY